MSTRDRGQVDGSLGGSFACAVCGAEAARVELVLGPPRPAAGGAASLAAATLVQRGFIGHATEGLADEAVPRVAAAILSGRARSLYEIDRLWAAFYCAECDASYCRAHWTTYTRFDDDFPGWYDCTYGVCPGGHRRLIDD